MVCVEDTYSLQELPYAMPGASAPDLSTGTQTPETGAGMPKPHLDLYLYRPFVT